MDTLLLTKSPIANTGMLIRRPVKEVFEAVVNPAVTTKFWFTKGSGRLEAGQTIRWEWEMYGVGGEVELRELDIDRRIVMEWDGSHGRTTVEWNFQPVGDEATFLTVTNSGFGGTPDQQVEEAAGSGQGFCWVLAGMKAWLEHGIQLNLVSDRYPKGLAEH